MQRCYEDLLRRDRSQAGRVVLHWKIDADGQVAVVTVEEATIADEQLLNCLAHQVMDLRFPAFDASYGPVEISFPFAFTAAP
jgi:hypothetical protein